MEFPKYEKEETVMVHGWTTSARGTIKDIKRIYYARCEEYCWGYRIEYDGEDAGLTFTYVPEGYLTKIPQVCKICIFKIEKFKTISA